MAFRKKIIQSFFNVFAYKTGVFITKYYGSRQLKKYRVLLDMAYSSGSSALHPETIAGYKFISACFAIVITILFIHNLFFLFPSVLAAGTAGFFIPDIFLKKVVNDRDREVKKDLPYIIDLLYITTLSGQNIYNSIRMLAQACKGKFAIDLESFIKLLDFGIARQDAFEHFKTCNSAEDLNSLLFLLIQAEKYGSSISEILKQKSRFLRFEILQRFETMSRRSSIILLFPLVFLILPAFILLVGGPLIFSIAGSFTQIN